jgi:ADP-heptose:LPS heptosyltransferase
LVHARTEHPNAVLYFLIFEKNRESCEILGEIPPERVLTIDDRSFFKVTFSTLRVLLKIRKLRIDTVIDLELFSRFTALVTYLTGARNRIGFHRYTNEGLYRGNFLTHPVLYNPHRHISLNFLALVCAINAPRQEIPLVKRDVESLLVPLPRIESSAEERREIAEVLLQENPSVTDQSPLIIVNPDPGDALPIRGWPLDRFAELSARMQRRYPDSFIVVIGLVRSRPHALTIREHVDRARFVDLTGRTRNLRALNALFERSKILVTNDCGPAHIAALAGTKTVALFGPETPALYGPLGNEAVNLYANYACSPCLTAANHRRTVCNDNRCLQAITVEEVERAVDRSLHAKPSLQVVRI